MEELLKLRKEVFRDGKMHRNEVDRVRELLLDNGGMNRKKGDFLFELKNTIQPENQNAEFKTMFVDLISALLLEDEDTPGEIDEPEAKWLRAKIQAKGYKDELDDRLLRNLRAKAINYPEILNFKSTHARWFENTLYYARYLTIFAVVGAALAAVALFVKGSLIVIEGLVFFFRTLENMGDADYEEMLATFVSSVDIYLFAMVLVIFSVGIYELFINKIDPVQRKSGGRPSWLQIKSIDDLKSSLGKVILMVLIVSFFKHSLDVRYANAVDLLELAIGVVLIAAALYIANKHHHTDHPKHKEPKAPAPQQQKPE